jgi:hypothetical protein
MEALDQYWLKRLQAVGKAQGRYLWILLISALFYAALRARAIDSTAETTSFSLKVPLIDIELSAHVVLASGAPVISFLVLAVTGALRAFGQARTKLGLGSGGDWSAEAVDTHPNAIDLALYTTAKSPKLIATVTYFVYPLFLTAALIEAAWLWSNFLDPSRHVPVWNALSVFALVFWVPAAWQVCSMWIKRVLNVRTLWNSGDC